MQAPEYDDLHWLAFRYVSDEMSPDESGAFEQRLEVDQAAREAVAGAVEMGQAVVACRTDAVPILRVRRRWVHWAAGMAACLAVAIVGSHGARLWRTAPAGDGSFVPSKLAPDAGQGLAIAWLMSDAHVEPADVRPDGWETVIATGPDEGTLTGNEADEPEVPGWMFQAVAADADANMRGDLN
jgi:hypothetical protein